jgi:hypothetical protein
VAPDGPVGLVGVVADGRGDVRRDVDSVRVLARFSGAPGDGLERLVEPHERDVVRDPAVRDPTSHPPGGRAERGGVDRHVGVQRREVGHVEQLPVVLDPTLAGGEQVDQFGRLVCPAHRPVVARPVEVLDRLRRARTDPEPNRPVVDGVERRCRRGQRRG